MSNYELYNKVLSTLGEEEGSFNAAARNWIEGAEDVHFEDEEANELFWQAKRHCATWRSNAINARVSKTRMINCVRQIAEKNLPNPYPVVKEFGVDPEEIKIQDEPEAIKGSTVKVEHVLGVIPEIDLEENKEKEEKPKFFNKRKNR